MTNDTQPVFEVRSRITRRSLMNRSKSDLADKVLELLAEVDRWRDLALAGRDQAQKLGQKAES